jgi:hypothetical protein
MSKTNCVLCEVRAEIEEKTDDVNIKINMDDMSSFAGMYCSWL